MVLMDSYDPPESIGTKKSTNFYLFITIRRDARQNPIVQIMQLNWREALKKEKEKRTPNENKKRNQKRQKRTEKTSKTTG